MSWKEHLEDPLYGSPVSVCADCPEKVLVVLGDRCSKCEPQFQHYLEKTAKGWLSYLDRNNP